MEKKFQQDREIIQITGKNNRNYMMQSIISYKPRNFNYSTIPEPTMNVNSLNIERYSNLTIFKFNDIQI